MDNRPLRAAVTKELTAASHEHNPAAEIAELVFHLELQLKRARAAFKVANVPGAVFYRAQLL